MPESRSYRVIRGLVLLFLILFTLFPLWTLITISLSSATEAGAPFRWFPSLLTFHPYVAMWRTAPLLLYLKNSAIVSSCSATASLPLALLAAYALTRHRIRGRGLVLRIVLATQAVPGILFLLPLFVLYITLEHTLGIPLDGTYLGLIITYLTFALPFSIWMLTGYLANMPQDIEEAARVDGASRLRAFITMTLRMAIPSIVAVGVFTFMTAWGEVLFASVLTDSATRTLPIGLQLYESAKGLVIYWNQLMAASLTVSIPVVIGFMLLQRYFVRGLGAGAIK